MMFHFIDFKPDKTVFFFFFQWWVHPIHVCCSFGPLESVDLYICSRHSPSQFLVVFIHHARATQLHKRCCLHQHLDIRNNLSMINSFSDPSCHRPEEDSETYCSSRRRVNFCFASSISPSTSSLERLKFSMLKAYTVTSRMSSCKHQRRVWRNDSGSGVKNVRQAKCMNKLCVFGEWYFVLPPKGFVVWTSSPLLVSQSLGYALHGAQHAVCEHNVCFHPWWWQHVWESVLPVTMRTFDLTLLFKIALKEAYGHWLKTYFMFKRQLTLLFRKEQSERATFNTLAEILSMRFNSPSLIHDMRFSV